LHASEQAADHQVDVPVRVGDQLVLVLDVGTDDFVAGSTLGSGSGEAVVVPGGVGQDGDRVDFVADKER
jgi:hypothetical protein